jgi:hypothetical protein
VAINLKNDVLPALNGVSVSTEILLALMVADGVWKRNGINELTVTSLLDGVHSPKSLHYEGKAMDLRTKGTGMMERLFQELKRALPPGYDVVLEDKEGVNEHIHVEWDPR